MSFLRRRRSTTVAPNLDQSLVLHLSKSRIPNPRQFKYIGRFLSSKERVVVSVSLVVAVGALLYLGILFYRNNIEVLPSKGGNYIEGVVGNPQYINPLYASLNDADADLEQLIFSRLFTRDNQGNIKNDLVDHFTISADGKTYSLTLRKANWQNGDELTVDDVIFTFNLIQNADYHSPLRDKFNGISISKVDDQTINFNLREPYHNFLRLLNFGILPQNAWDSVPAQTIPLAELNIKPIGSGPYIFKSLVKNKNGTVHSYTIERNPSYYDQAPYLDEITFKFFPSNEEMTAALNNGQINGSSYLDQTAADLIIAKNSFDYHAPALPQLTALFFNLKSKNLIADKTIRQALSLAIDRESIVKDGVGHWGSAAYSLLPKFADNAQNSFRFDQNRANELLDRDFWPKREGSTERFKDDKQLTITLLAPESLKTTAEAVARAWQAIGVKTQLVYKTDEAFEREVIAGKAFDIALYRETITNGDPYSLWRSDAQANISSWQNKKVDSLLEEARLGNDATAQKNYQTFLALAADEIPASPLFWQTYVYPQHKKIKGFSMTSVEDPSERFSQAQNWYLNTERHIKKNQ